MPDDGKAEIDVAAITKSVTEAVTKTVIETLQPKLAGVDKVSATIDELAKNQKVLADTIAQLPPAKVDPKTDAKKDDVAAPITTDAVAKIVADAIAADRKAQAEQTGKAAAREATVQKLVKEKLGGDADFANLLTAQDEEGLAKQADALAAKVKTLKPDFGGAAKDGGDNPVKNPAQDAKPVGNLSPGAAKYAASVQLPGSKTA